MTIQTPHTRGDGRSPGTDEMPVYDAEDLLHGGRKAFIMLQDQWYTLQITKQGKLLLTK